MMPNVPGARADREEGFDVQKMLVPLDGSEQARGILPFVSYLASGMGSKLRILSVINPNDVRIPGVERKAQSEHVAPMAVGYTGIVGAESGVGAGSAVEERFPTRPREPGGPYATQAFDRAESRLRRDLSQVADELAGHDLTARTAVRFGDAAEEIERYAKTHDCDLIAMSTHGRNMVSRAILGSVTDKIIRTSDLPTLAITPNKAAQYWTSEVAIPLKAAHTALALKTSLLPDTAVHPPVRSDRQRLTASPGKDCTRSHYR